MGKYIKKTDQKYYRHGLRKDPLYPVWLSIKQRCNNKNNVDYHSYGGRGISICDEWYEFINFYNWSISNGYKRGLSIDRINNDGDYTPENCRFVGWDIQNNNKRKYKVQTNTIKYWCIQNGIFLHYRNISRYLNSGKSKEWVLQKYKSKCLVNK